MYTPKLFKVEDWHTIKEVIKQNSFATLVTSGESKIQATHIPLILKEEGSRKFLYGHVARGNQQWKSFGEEEVLTIFQSHHSYVSSSWYNHINVPTYNYIAVHAYGKLTLIEKEELFQSLCELTDTFEANNSTKVKVEELPKELVAREMLGIVGFKIELTRIEASFKLSQNRDNESYKNIILNLQEEQNENASGIAKEMKNRRPEA